MPGQEHDEPVDPAFATACERVAELFALARSSVFDRYPHGLPPRDELTSTQRRRLEELERAEQELDDLRRRRRERRALSCDQ